MAHIQLYDKNTIDNLPWKQVREGDRMGPFLSALVKEDIPGLIANVQTELLVLAIDDLAVPITVNCTEYGNSHVCSPYTHYITAAFDEVQLFASPLLRGIIRKILHILSPLLKWGRINQLVSVNNWLIPTNLYPEMSCAQIQEISRFLKNRFPSHAIQFRSLNQMTNRNLMDSLQNVGYKLVLSRPVYLIDGSESHFFTANNFKKDLALVLKSPYAIESEILSQDFETIKTLYKEVYLEKHVSHNPQFTTRFVELISKSECWCVRVLKEKNRIDGVFAYLQIGKVMTLPFFGYETSLPQDLGLYRIISALVALEAKKKGIIFNQSAGAASFKRLRRAIPQLEYCAIYDAHLPVRQKLPWLLLRLFLNQPGGYLLKRFGI